MICSKPRKLRKIREILGAISSASEEEINWCVKCLFGSTVDFQDSTIPITLRNKILHSSNLRFLCHLDLNRHCAGCCDDFTTAKDALATKYHRRRCIFECLVQEKDDLLNYKSYIKGIEENDESCPFVAFLDSDGKSVGCLLHPKIKSNNGVDLRNYGKHGKLLCDAYVCSSIKTLESKEAEDRLFLLNLIELSGNWYAYSRLFSPSVSRRYHRGLIEILLSSKKDTEA